MVNNRNDGVHQHIDGPIRQALRSVLPEVGWDVAEELVGRLSAEGQLAASTLLIYAQAKGRLEAALRELEQEWESVFRDQDPELRGDPNCLDNLVRFAAVYDRIGVMPPWEERR